MSTKQIQDFSIEIFKDTMRLFDSVHQIPDIAVSEKAAVALNALAYIIGGFFCGALKNLDDFDVVIADVISHAKENMYELAKYKEKNKITNLQ